MKEGAVKKVRETPGKPGVYLFRDLSGTIIYIGKARNLKNRLMAYTRYSDGQDPRLRNLANNISDLEVVITNNEIEALLLESTLIKKHKPRYNILLKDDKSFPYIRIDPGHRWPGLSITRKPVNDGAKYFGPYTSARSLKLTVSILNRIFKLRKCSDNVFKTAKRPCLNYQIGNCLSPCSGKIKHKNYLGIVDAVIKVLNGDIDVVVHELEREMLMASDNQDYEEAARIREAMKSLDVLARQQFVVFTGYEKDVDFITIGSNRDSDIINVLYIRRGRLSGQINLAAGGGADKGELLQRFLVDHYRKNMVPDVIHVPLSVEDLSVEKFLTSIKGSSGVSLCHDPGGKWAELGKMAEKNIRAYMHGIDREGRDWQILSSHLAELLGLKSISLVECYDMSNISGKFQAGAKIAYEKGKFNKSLYRKYKIRGNYRGDDPAMMREVLKRRFSGTEAGIIPDLVLIDGGRTQLKSAYDTAVSLHLELNLVSIAKDKELARGLSKDRIYVVRHRGVIERMDVNDKILNFFKMLRDEAHRFVITYHRKLRDKV
ncbi:MAG: excinuclease ABC subunit UvrC [Oligoflexia bacterium]|nr:excinuclease ABC subunit UvrC [Oligoflexia bacterium]